MSNSTQSPAAATCILPFESTCSLENLPPSDITLSYLSEIYKHPARIYDCMVHGIWSSNLLAEIDNLETFDTSGISSADNHDLLILA